MSYKIVKKFNSVTTNTSTDPIYIGPEGANADRTNPTETVVQVDITGTAASVAVEVRLHPDLSWVVAEDGINAGKLVVIDKAAQVRLTVTGINSATVTGAVMQ